MFSSGRNRTEASISANPKAGPARAGASRAASRRRASRRGRQLRDSEPAGYAFLVGTLIDAKALARACRFARRWHTSPHRVLISLGWISEPAYATALARHLGLGLTAAGDADSNTAVEAVALQPGEIALLAQIAAAEGRTLRIATRDAAAWNWASSSPNLDDAAQQAADGLRRQRPEWSAAEPMWLWQRLACTIAGGLILGGAAIEPGAILAALFALIALPFIVVTSVRMLALWQIVRPSIADRRRPHLDKLAESELPVYTVLVPLHDEADVVSNLLEGLNSLDYPKPRLDILLILEEGDAATRARFAEEVLPPHMRVVVVPGGKPQTKPRALNFALAYARGDFVVVYAAEDDPEPDQLRQALAVVLRNPEQVGCVQARLNIYNPRDSLLTRQFTIEYSALFDGILPALARFDLPTPLGGTSNHFPRALLDALGGWAPYNVASSLV